MGPVLETVPCLWSADPKALTPDSYVGFRGVFTTVTAGHITFRLFGAAWYVVWVDGQWLTEGPPRFRITHPEYQTVHVDLPAGRHVIAVQAHHEGVSTRMLDDVPAFWFCRALAGETEIPVAWKCQRFEAYTGQVRRINPQLGWIEWCDTRRMPANWTSSAFDDAEWIAPTTVERKLGPLRPVTIGETKNSVHPAKRIGEGKLAEMFGYEFDNPAARFALRDLACRDFPAQGVWRRYDVGRVRLMKPRFVLDVPEGTLVEFAYCETLIGDRVVPWINFSAGDSCNLDHYIARGGVQEFCPLTPKGGRFVEIHVFAPAEKIRFLKEEVVERGYYAEPAGALDSGDDLLNRIWSTGIETLRGCSEDALTDNPTRERGQWTGDVATVGIEIAAAGYADLRLFRRALVQCGQCAREDGLVAGLCPGGVGYLSTYAASWVTACIRYWELTGDKTILDELFDVARRNVGAFEARWTEDGLRDDLGWGFVDWGYVRNPGPSDMGVNLHYFAALCDMVRWSRQIGKTIEAAQYETAAEKVRALLQRWFNGQRRDGKIDWKAIGYHRGTLGLRLGFFDQQAAGECRAFMKAHMLDCFPNNPVAPRLSDPGANNPQLITPYFGHYAFPPLIEHGDMDFALEQFRRCWGWALGGKRTTWLEVFDVRWSHCHQWAGCPTWLLTRYLLGLQTRFDLGANHYTWIFQPGSLSGGRGRLPLPHGRGVIEIDWKRTGRTIQHRIQTPEPIWLHLNGMEDRLVEIKGLYEQTLESPRPRS